MHFKLLMVFVDDDKTDKVLDAARGAGATGATIITNAHGQGLEKTIGIFGLEILNPRDVLLILVEGRRVDTVLAAVAEAGQLDESMSTGGGHNSGCRKGNWPQGSHQGTGEVYSTRSLKPVAQYWRNNRPRTPIPKPVFTELLLTD